EPLAAGKANRDPSLPPLDTVVGASLAIGDDVEKLAEFTRPNLALYVGGMGAKGKNFYNNLARRYGFEKEAETIQDLYLSGKKDEAAAAVPAELVQSINLIGPEGYVRDRIAAFAEAGVTTLTVHPIGNDHAARVALVEKVKEMAS
ncbi:MAG TPA: LLM class flavin-dependent oxidoreductase, partial [Mycobacteriales bacterium]